MENQNQNQNNTSKLKAIILVLSLLLLGSLAYMFKMSSDAKKLENQVTTVSNEKESILKDLEELKATYDAAIAENTSLSNELIAERDKVAKLIDEVKRSKGEVASLSQYRRKYNELQVKMNDLIKQNEQLIAENKKLTSEIDSTKTILIEAKEYNQVLVGQNEELSKTVEKASKLIISDLKTGAYKVRNSGKEIPTEKASRADILKVSFKIQENKVAKSGDKTYYVQIIDSKNNVLGDKQTETFGDKSLTYSFTTSVKYENSAVLVSENLPGKNFEKGTYFVNVFDKNELVSKTSFTLK